MANLTLSKTVTVRNFVFNDLSGNNHFIAKPNGWRQYGKIEVDKNGGALIERGSFAQVEVYCRSQDVQISDGGLIVSLPEGSSADWANTYFPTYPQNPTAKWCVVIFQVTSTTTESDGSVTATVSYAKVTATSQKTAQIFDIPADVKDIYVTINDSHYEDGSSAYGDNSGTFEINVNLIAPTEPKS